MTSTRTFRCQPEAVTAARRFVREMLGDQALEVSEAAELMTSELVTNCVRHAQTDFELTIHSHGQIRVEVRDTGPGRPRLLSPTSRELTGRGLRIVEAMADDWGVVPTSQGKAVWFTLTPAVASGKSLRARRGGDRAAEASDPPKRPSVCRLDARPLQRARKRLRDLVAARRRRAARKPLIGGARPWTAVPLH